MRIDLIFPARDRETITAVIRTPPAGITLLAALVPDGIEVRLVDMLAGDQPDFADPPDLVGITTRTPVAAVAYDLADRYRQLGVPVVLGGPHASAVPLDAARHADAVAVGEAENTWPRLLADFERRELRRFYVCGALQFEPGDSPVHHEPGYPALAGIPSARRDLLPRDRYALDTLFSTRGCPYDCSFCPVRDLFGSRLRHRPIDEVVAEAGTIKNVYFNVDDNIFGVPGHYDYYLDLYTELAKVRPARIWTGQGGLGALDDAKGREVLAKAVDCGLESVSIGIESVSPQGLGQSQAWKKLSADRDAGLTKTAQQIRILQDHGLFVSAWFVVGWDGDDLDSYQRSLEFADRSGVAPIIVNLLPLPGTRMYRELVGAGRLDPDTPWEDYSLGSGRAAIFLHPNMTREEMGARCRETMVGAYAPERMRTRALVMGCDEHDEQALGQAIARQRNLGLAFGGGD